MRAGRREALRLNGYTINQNDWKITSHWSIAAIDGPTNIEEVDPDKPREAYKHCKRFYLDTK